MKQEEGNSAKKKLTARIRFAIKLRLQEPVERSCGQVASAESGTTACIMCSEVFDEDWIQCLSCGGWAHEN
jgi:hypothetical protein